MGKKRKEEREKRKEKRKKREERIEKKEERIENFALSSILYPKNLFSRSR